MVLTRLGVTGSCCCPKILITCGASQLDGYAFCEGLKNLDIPYEESVESQIWIRSVTFLIQQAIFRTKSPIWWSGRTSLEINPLPELIDMYHSHKATIRHDKIFSLLGMNSDDLTGTRLSPDYNVPWVEVFDRLLRYIFGKNLQTEILGDGDLAVIRTKCQIIGKIVSVKRDISWSDRQEVEASLWSEATKSKEKAQLTFSASAEPILSGDFICFLQNTPTHMIVRAFNDYFRLIKTAAIWDEINPGPNWTNLPEDVPRNTKRDHLAKAIKSMNTSPDLLLVWDWSIHDDIFYNQEYGDLETRWCKIQTGSELKAERLSNAAFILAEWDESVKFQKRIRDAFSFCYDTVGKDHLSTLRCLDALGWAQKRNQQFEEAEYTLIQAIQTRARVQGATHSDTLSSMNALENLALICKWNGTSKEQMAEKRITVILSVLKRKDNDSLTDEDIIYFATFVDAKTMLFIIESRGHEFKITEDVLQAVIRRSDQEAKEIINLLFDKRREEIKITEEVFKFAGEISRTKDIVRRFLEERSEECKITEEVVEAAARNSQTSVLQLLLRHAGDQFKVTESFFKAVTRCANRSMIEVLLKERGDEIKITEEVVEAAIKNPRGDHIVLSFLCNCGNEFSITEELLIAPAESPCAADIWWLFIHHRGNEIWITPRVLESAARYESGFGMIFHMFKTLGSKRSLTEEIVKLAAGNMDCGHRLITTFLRERRDEVQVTEHVIRVACGNELSIHGAQIMNLLLDRLGDSPSIPDKVLRAIPKEWRSQEKINDWIRTRRHQGRK